MVRDHKPMAVNITRETTARYDYMPLAEILVMKYSSQKKKNSQTKTLNLNQIELVDLNSHLWELQRTVEHDTGHPEDVGCKI